MLFQPAKPKDKIRFVLSFSFVWVGTEYMRSVFWPQFPWNLTAHLFCFEDFIVPSLMIQIVSWGGVYVLSLIWSLFLASFYSASTMLKSMTILLLVGGMGYGGWVLFAPSSKTQQKLRTFRVMVVQPNISQKEKVASEMAEDILKKTWDFTLKAGGGKSGVGLIVWPETALLHMITPTHPILKKIQKALPAKTFLIFGADRLSSIASKRPVWHNSLFVLSKTEILATYDKTRLLPFGEYMPLRKFFPHFLNRIVPGVDCTPGPSVLPLKIKGFPSFLPRICSESLYKTPKTSAQWIVHILNDGWFPLPFLWQHLAADRLRTVESGLPLLRVSNTGISVFIDVLGRIKHQLPIQRQAAQEVEVSASED
ncbi:hypothetical protein AGMMS49949_05620 [Alphaproteobacteria bacterium]|nr:hypothetical protein AGMMS49949_05620 [Alphaproteobacteria bacterium]GHS97785.1 hypothetical protein AGMMS50296_5070 [Alphaproteobacteria bacterium]